MNTTAPKPTTVGEARVRIDFNPSALDAVSVIKTKAAELINLLNEMKTNTPAPGETGFAFGEKMRLISLAQTSFEEGAMWGVKAATAPVDTNVPAPVVAPANNAVATPAKPAKTK